jgi:hypothetical protein
MNMADGRLVNLTRAILGRRFSSNLVAQVPVLPRSHVLRQIANRYQALTRIS